MIILENNRIFHLYYFILFYFILFYFHNINFDIVSKKLSSLLLFFNCL